MLQTNAWIGDNLSTNFTLNPVGSKAFEITLGATSFSEGGNVKLLGDLGSAPEIMETSWGEEGIVIKSDHDLSKPVATFSARDVDGDQLSVTMSENIFEVVSRENDAGTPADASDDFFEFDLFVKNSADGGPVLSSVGFVAPDGVPGFNAFALDITGPLQFEIALTDGVQSADTQTQMTVYSAAGVSSSLMNFVGIYEETFADPQRRVGR